MDDIEVAVVTVRDDTPSSDGVPPAPDPGGRSASAPMPRHIAMIMDGNGRWAAQRGLPRLAGHRAGVETLRRIVEHAGVRGLTHLTVFGFSTENWRRPPWEVEGLFDLLRHYIEEDLDRLARDGVRLRIIGRRTQAPADVIEAITRAEVRTRENAGLRLTIAFDYGGRDEIVRAAQRLAEAAVRGEVDLSRLTEDDFARGMDTGDLPEPDLIVRTSGEYRLSNFLLWGAAYAELYMCDTLWPEFSARDLDDAIAWFRTRQRRFGALEGAAG
jgi:undecaprenyl diphosphate synthase